MGICTFALDTEGFSPMDGNEGYRVRGVITLSSSYATGGDTLNASAVGLGEIHKIDIGAAAPTAHTTAYLLSSLGTPGVAPTIQAFWTGSALSGAFAEVTAATDLHTVTAQCVITGF